MAFPTSFTEALRPHLAELEAAAGKARSNLARWERVIAELGRLRDANQQVALIRLGLDAQIADARGKAQQMRDVLAGLDPLLTALVEQGPPTLGFPPIAWPLVAGAFVIAGYGAVETITDVIEVVSQNEKDVAAYETQLGIARELNQAMARCGGGPGCDDIVNAFVDVAQRDPTTDDSWPWWVWALVLGVPVIGGIATYAVLSGRGRRARRRDK